MATEQRSIEEVSRTVVRIQSGVLTIVCALIGGFGLFAMTAWLLIKNGPNVGVHLNLLGHYFIGYSVTWTGSLIGLCYGAAVGGIFGWTIGRIYNAVVSIRHG